MLQKLRNVISQPTKEFIFSRHFLRLVCETTTPATTAAFFGFGTAAIFFSFFILACLLALLMTSDDGLYFR